MLRHQLFARPVLDRNETGGIKVDAERLVMTVQEAWVKLGISRALAYELVRQGRIPSLRLGRRLVVPTRLLMEMVDKAKSCPVA